jgi:outer membrane protein insertion porin family
MYMKRITIVIGLMLLCSALTFGQTTTSTTTSTTIKPQVTPAAPQTQTQAQDPNWFWNKTITSFQWEGLKDANRNELDSTVQPYLGKKFTQELWLDLQSKLYGLDWFDSIEPIALHQENSPDTLIIKFQVKEKPSILSIRVSGNDSLSTSEVLGAVASKVGDIYSTSRASLDDIAIQKLYNEKGYPDAAVTHTSEVSESKNSVTLIFKVIEGSKVAIRSIKFTGNSSASENTLKSQIPLKEAGLFQPGAFQESKLEDSKKAIIDYYQSRGYVDAKIIDVFRSYEKETKTGKNWLTLTFAISEGKKWNFGGINFSGNTIFSTEKLTSIITLKPGSPLNYKRLLEDKQKIDDLYYESGYIYNQITLNEKRNEADSSISYTVDIVEHERAHIENLTFKGNQKTKEYVLAREMPLQVGDVFSKTKIVDGLRNLYNLQYFSSIQPEIHQGSAGNLMDLVINVAEMSTSDVQFGITLTGLGQTGTFPLSGFVKWNDRNLNGTGQNLQTNLTISPTTQSLDTSFGESWLFGKRISRSFSLSLNHSTETTGQDILGPTFTDQDIPDPFTGLGSGTNQWNGSLSSIPTQYLMPYENWSGSVGLNLGYTAKSTVGDLGIGGGVSSGLGMINYDETKYRPYEAEFRDTNRQWLLTNKIYIRTYLNSLDYWYNPGNGLYLSQRFTLTGLLPFERQHYIKSESRIDAYLKLFTIPITDAWKFSMVLAGHSGFQVLLDQPWNTLQVTQDWISLDGTFNARGWKSLYGTKGIMLWENSLELRMPIIDQMLWLDLFLDAGAMKMQSGWLNMTLDTPAVDGTAFGWKSFAFSTGLGFRFIVPQFPFRFYLVKRFVFDGSAVTWKTTGTNVDFVLSITQPLY